MRKIIVIWVLTSTIFSFLFMLTATALDLGIPPIISPKTGDVFSKGTVSVEWSAISGATSYGVAITDTVVWDAPKILGTTKTKIDIPDSYFIEGRIYRIYVYSIKGTEESGRAIIDISIKVTSPPTPTVVPTSVVQPRLIFLYVNGNESLRYNKSDIDKVNNATGFVICHVGGRNYCSFQYKGENGTQCDYFNYLSFINEVKLSINSILESNTNAEIWIATPATIANDGLNQYSPTNTELSAYLADLHKNIIDSSFTANVISGSYVWQNNIKGIYFYDEFYYGDNGLNYMSRFKDCINNNVYYSGKKTMWAPPYNSENYDTNNDGMIEMRVSNLLNFQNVNKKTICDYVMIQPNYYFAHTQIDVFDYILPWIDNNKINNIDAGNTKLGIVMEINQGVQTGTTDGLPGSVFLTADECKNRYEVYKIKCAKYSGNKPIVFYSDAREQMVTTEVCNRIQEFYKFGINAISLFNPVIFTNQDGVGIYRLTSATKVNANFKLINNSDSDKSIEAILVCYNNENRIIKLKTSTIYILNNVTKNITLDMDLTGLKNIKNIKLILLEGLCFSPPL